MKIAALQMVSAPDLATNLATAERLIDQAVAEGAQLVSLPEYFVQMGLSETDKLTIAEELGHGPIQHMLTAKARQHAIWVAGGSLPIKTLDPAKVTNTALLFNPQGERVARYDKMHLFSYQDGTRHLDEGRTMVAGTSVVVADTPFGRVGMSICYDLRFAELYRAMGEVNLILVPSAFTVPTGTAHWLVLLRARAIENQCYVLAAAQGGTHASGRQTYGHSMLIDPWGEVVAELPLGEGVVMGQMDPERLKSVRHHLQALQHRRLNTEMTGTGGKHR
ncbi:carbon-nitrogen hydrolase family protein [Limnohabitans sp.]|uniref:carbon-nitrogen hydrolase family protein n=1 Tax=Limnohabitans sp. TaxID=1907725 RepID=UPI0039BC505B|nr:carbon-nitrogen hydrolase family protein [Comamonadaceae bacterium]